MTYQEFYHAIYASPLPRIRTLMLIGVFTWTLLTFLCGLGRRSARVWCIINRVLAVCSVLGVLVVTCLSRAQGEATVSLRLFHVPASPAAADEYPRMLLMNVFLYLPLGLSLTCAWSRTWSLTRRVSYTLAGGMALSLFCEVLQFITRRGVAEIDDLAMNVAGTALGAAAAVLAWLMLCPVHAHNKSKRK